MFLLDFTILNLQNIVKTDDKLVQFAKSKKIKGKSITQIPSCKPMVDWRVQNMNLEMRVGDLTQRSA